MNFNFKNSTQKITFIAFFVSVLVVLSQVSIPLHTGVPITLQTFALGLIGYILGAKLGVFTVFCYILLGVVGIPVFSNFGSFSSLIGPTGGFIFGFLPMVYLLGLKFKNKLFTILCGVVALVCCHILGVLQFAFLKEMGFVETFMIVSFPYLLKDAISIIIAYGMSKTIIVALKKIEI